MTGGVGRASAPGKVNLALWSGSRDDRGYHPLTTVFEAVGLREYVEVREITGTSSRLKTLVYRLPSDGGQPRLDSVSTRDFAPLDQPSNLAWRAVELLAPGASAEITVHKVLPVAGGMAGGSADAAAALAAANDCFQIGLSRPQLCEAGATLGSDVPACVVGGVSLGLGRGDQMQQLHQGTSAPGRQSRWWCLVFAEEGLSTPTVFAEFDRQWSENEAARSQEETQGKVPTIRAARPRAHTTPGVNLSGQVRATLMRPGTQIAPALHNDLAAAALTLRPELLAVGEACKAAGSLTWMVSGSGPTIAALCQTPTRAQEVAQAVSRLPGVRATTVTWGPGVGARLEERLPEWCAPPN